MINQSGLNSSWTDSLNNNKIPDGTNLVDHLRNVHKEFTGFTENCASACRDKDGRNSYEWLSDIVPNKAGARILDLACGSGLLLKILYNRQINLNLKGVDMSSEELSLARTRLPDNVDLLELKAQDLNLINDESMDYVLCHWALTLMDPVSPVLNEVRRILTPKGVFAALVDGPIEAASAYGDVHDLIYGYVQKELPNYGNIDLGDPRIRGTDSLAKLVSEIFPQAKVTVETSTVSMEGPIEQIAETAAGFFYAAFVLPDERKKNMLSDLCNLLSTSNQNNNKQGRFTMPINRLLVTPN